MYYVMRVAKLYTIDITAELMGEHTVNQCPECSDDAELVKFSSYFKNKISDIHKSFPPPPPPLCTPNDRLSTYYPCRS